MAARSLLGLSRSLRKVEPTRSLSSLNQSFTQFGAHSPSSHSSSLSENASGQGLGRNHSRTPSVSSLFSGTWGVSRGDGRTGLSPQATRCYSSVALETWEDEAVQEAAEIGYEVLGQYAPDGPRTKPQAAFAVVQIGSHQFKVTPGDMIYTEKLKYADINDKLLLNKVLLMGSLKQTIIGRPIIPEAGVFATVEEIALDEKVIIFKKKRRKNYRRTNGHRQELTRLRILRINGIDTPTEAEGDAVPVIMGTT